MYLRNSSSSVVLFLGFFVAVGSATTFAQTATVTVMGPDGQPRTISRPMPPGATPPGATPPGGEAKPGGEKKDGEKDSKDAKDGKSGDGKNDSPEPKVIRRGDQQVGEADPAELKATVGEDGKVAFQFRNQPWVDLVQWLAQIAGEPLDWQELPGDRVNLRSPGRYTVEETKDLFNRHLLARGYTLLDLAGGITIAKTEGINPAMVPRVSVEELDELMPHTFVRTSLELGWLSSEKLAEELKPMISSNGRLTPLTTTNRIEAMDEAINLRQVAKLLEQERNQSSREALAPEFRLRYISAESAKKMLEQFLGVEKKSTAPMTPQQMQMMQQMQQRNGGAPTPQPKQPEISIVADTRQNTIYIRAPVDRIAVATEFINRIDVPGQGLASLADVESNFEVFRLYSIDPDKLIEIIGEMNVLEPSTHLRADDDNKALIVSGSAADRYIIERLIKRLDGSGRSFEVLQLRRLEATEVAESIAFLMGKDKDKKDDNNSRRYFYYGFGGNQDDNKDDDEFRVAANARYRQVLLWANESEMEQVRNLLIKLGEMPPPGGSRSTVRRIDASSSPETYEYLLQLQKQWSQMSNTPLQLPGEDEFVDPLAPSSDAGDGESEEESGPEGLDLDSADADTAIGSSDQTLVAQAATPNVSDESDTSNDQGIRLTAAPVDESVGETPTDRQGTETPADQTPADQTTAQSDSDGDGDAIKQPTIQSGKDFDRVFGNRRGNDSNRSETPGEADTRAAAAPIKIQLDDDGNLVLTGGDPRALDQLENLMLQVAPPRRPYHVFKIKHQSAYYVQLNLEEYFEEKESDDSGTRGFMRYYFGFDSGSDDEGPAGLGKSNELRFVQDPDTNTIVVSGATNSQLRTIKELIKLWDVAEPVNKRRMRYTKLVNVEYGDAEQIAETIKEAYRDLLSSNDKTFNKNGPGGGGPGGGRAAGQGQKSSGRESQGSGLVDSENGRDGGDVDFSFKGKLSMGIDSVGNTLLVSAEGEPLLELVVEMIRKLDIAAKPAGDMQIISVPGNTSSDSIESLLKAFGGGSTSAPAPTPSGPQRPPRPGRPFDGPDS